jgi:hypothetical protein
MNNVTKALLINNNLVEAKIPSSGSGFNFRSIDNVTAK